MLNSGSRWSVGCWFEWRVLGQRNRPDNVQELFHDASCVYAMEIRIFRKYANKMNA